MSASKPVSTRLLLLMEIHNRPHAKLKPLAERLGVSAQAVSVVLRRLLREGLVESREGVWRPTQRGTDTLHRTMRDLQRFVEESMGDLRLIEETVAQADAPIRRGEKVGLYMRDGRLRAAPRVYAASWGHARAAARRGALVRVADLRGIVSLRPAEITIVGHPMPLTLRQRRRASRLLSRLEGGRVAAHELESAVLLETLGRRADFQFAPLSAALEASRLGVPVLYWVPQRHLPECLAAIGQRNGEAPQGLRVRSVEL